MKNPIYRIALQQAKKLITNPKKTKDTVDRAMRKSGKIKKGSKLIHLKDDLLLFFSMIVDSVTLKYRKLPLKTGIKVLAAVLYFLFVIDLIPDFFAVIGLTDDAAVLAWVIKSVSKDTAKYKEWKKKRSKLSEDPAKINSTS